MSIQLAGKKCAICDEKIFVNIDATYCARCESPLCHSCLSAGTICPQCRRLWDDPTQYYVYARYCPDCMATVDGKSACKKCGEATMWLNKDEYEHFRKHLLSWCRWSVPVGVSGIIGGLLVMVAPFGFFWIASNVDSAFPTLLFAVPILGIPLIVNGIVRIIRGHRRRKFE